MKITFLGTSADSSYPLIFCRCANCEQARTLGGPSLRKRASALVNHDLLLDLGPDVMTSSFLHNCSLSGVRYCLQTHAHSDHLELSHLIARSPEYAAVDVLPLQFYASPATVKKVLQGIVEECPDNTLLDQTFYDWLNLKIHPVEPFQAFDVGNYHVTAFPANHDQSVDPLLYAIEANGQTLFYGTDTAAFPEEVWQGFHQARLRFDVVVLDHTFGIHVPDSDSHLNAKQFIEHITRMRNERLLSENARVFATHISHEGNPVHPQLAEFAARHGYEIAYDGLIV